MQEARIGDSWVQRGCSRHEQLRPEPPPLLHWMGTRRGLELAATLADRLRAYPGLPTLRRLSSPYAVTLLTLLQRWLRHLHQHRQRWSRSTFPSVPLLSAEHLLVFWNSTDPALLPTAPHGSQWFYAEAHGYQYLTLIRRCADPAPCAVLWAPTCDHCGRPLPLYGCFLHLSPEPFSSLADFCCWSTPPGTPLTAAAASRSTVSLGDLLLQGVLPISLLRRRRCNPVGPGQPPILTWRVDAPVPLLRPGSPTSLQECRIPWVSGRNMFLHLCVRAHTHPLEKY